jgi:hypothetical protein
MVAAGRARLALSSVARREAPRRALQRSSSGSLEDAASFEEVRQDLRAIARFWFHERRATVPRRGYDCGLPLRVGDCLKQKPPVGGRCGDEPAVPPATRRQLVAFQLGSDVVGVVDACSRARATVRMLAGGPRQGALSKRIGRAERVARLHNLSADVLIANVAAPVRER